MEGVEARPGAAEVPGGVQDMVSSSVQEGGYRVLQQTGYLEEIQQNLEV